MLRVARNRKPPCYFSELNAIYPLKLSISCIFSPKLLDGHHRSRPDPEFPGVPLVVAPLPLDAGLDPGGLAVDPLVEGLGRGLGLREHCKRESAR